MSDRHLSNAIGDLFGVERPEVSTDDTDRDPFIPGTPSPVTGSVAFELQSIAESVAARATAPSTSASTCDGDELECARTFIRERGTRAYRRALSDAESQGLLGVYEDGRELGGSHRSGIALVIQALIQSPSFIYELEAGATEGGEYRLGPHETAAKIALFLEDTVPDDLLFQAAEEGLLATPEGLRSEVQRLLDKPSVQANLQSMLSRFFALDDVTTVTKASEVGPFSRDLAIAMRDDSEHLIEEVLLRGSGRLSDLLTSRSAWVTPDLASLYGVDVSAGVEPRAVMLPPSERSGILTRPALMTVRASATESSAIFRGLLVARGLLCLEPPPPAVEDVELGEMINQTALTERERAQRREEVGRCGPCHGQFDPLGLTFEHYDAIGAYRGVIETAEGDVPVDASSFVDLADIEAVVTDAVDLSEHLAGSAAVRECMVKQIVTYALARPIASDELCAVGEVAERFESSGGDLNQLIVDIATWPGLVVRRSEGDGG